MDARGLKVALALDCALESAGILALLVEQPGFTVSALPAGQKSALEWICHIRPQVALLTAQRDGVSTLPLVSALRRHLARSATVVLAQNADVDAAGAVLAAGAAAYVMQGARAGDLIATIRAVAEGPQEWGVVVARTQAIHHRLADAARAGETGGENASQLTRREREILALIASSLTTRGIADRLALSPTTIATHRANVMRKLGLRNAAELTRFAWSSGVLPR